MTIYSSLKHVAFKIDPELAHELTLKGLSFFPNTCSHFFSDALMFSSPKYSLKLGRIEWPYPVGLAAGLDKNAQAIDFFSQLAFGFIEVGTVTPLPQPGNPRPRLFRYENESSLRNCMGFNNEGAEQVFQNILSSHKNGKILGVNLGKNKMTSEKMAYNDYLILYEKFAPIADYLVINVSSPNTPGLRALQQTEHLKDLFNALASVRKKVSCPLFLKISPDLPIQQLDEILNLIREYRLEGLIATNTTIMPDRGEGGVSGKLLANKAKIFREEVLKRLDKDKDELTFIGVGGISHFSDIWDFWSKGGKILQIYTSFIYQGPDLLLSIKNSIDEILAFNDLPDLSELFQNIESVKCPKKLLS